MSLIAFYINRIIGIFAAGFLSYIFFSGTVTGVVGIFFLLLVVVFLIAGFVSPCSLSETCDSGVCKTEEQGREEKPPS